MPANNKELDKNLIDILLKDMANKYRKIDKKGYQPVDIVIVGGGSVVVNYGFRTSTIDIDAIINASDTIRDIAIELSYKYEISSHWFNSDFTILSSYSPKLLEVSEHYKSYNNGKFNVRTVKSEYLIAMKMKSGRFYNDDIPDIIGILASEKRNGNSIKYDKISAALSYLYKDWMDISSEITDRVEKYCELSVDDLWQEYDKMKQQTYDVNNEILTEDNREKITGKQDAKELSEKIFIKLSEKYKKEKNYDQLHNLNTVLQSAKSKSIYNNKKSENNIKADKISNIDPLDDSGTI